MSAGTAPLTGAGLAATPRWFPHLLDPLSDQMLFVEKTEEEYRQASFLDERSLRPDAARRIVGWEHLAPAFPPAVRRDARFIFHIGHVGSTLIARLLGELPAVLSLREPLVLRVLADMAAERGKAEALWDPGGFEDRVDIVRALLSRSFRPGQRALVKATSYVSDIGTELAGPEGKALLLYCRPERYMTTILAGENSRRELAMTAQARLERLHRTLGAAPWRLWEMGEGERLGAAWATEMASLNRVAAALGARALWMDFDDYLAAPEAALARLIAFFGFPAESGDPERLARHPLAGRYSKAPEHGYSAELRADLLAEAAREHRATLGGALAWLERAAADHAAIGAALDAASTRAPGGASS